MKIFDVESAAKELDLPRHTLQFTEKMTIRETAGVPRTTEKISALLKARLADGAVDLISESEISVEQGRVTIRVEQVPKSENKEVSVTWSIDVRHLF